MLGSDHPKKKIEMMLQEDKANLRKCERPDFRWSEAFVRW